MSVLEREERVEERVRALKEERLARILLGLAEEAPRSLRAHARLLMEDAKGNRLAPASHHGDWIDVLEDREHFPGVVIVAPPSSAKSTWATMAYASWEVGRSEGRIRVGMIANNATLATAFSKSVQDTVVHPLWRVAYPDVRPDERRKWTEAEWYVTGCPKGPNPTMLAAGITGPIQGKRFDLICLDDPTKWEEARSPQVMEKQRAWLKNTLIKRFPEGTGPPTWEGGESRMVVATTRWSDNDLVPVLEDMGFAIVRTPALGYWDRTATCPSCGAERDPSWRNLELTCEHCGSAERPEVTFGEEALWPEAVSAETLRAARDEDELIFELVMQGNTRVLAGNVFDPLTFRRGELPSSFDKVVMFADTAGGKDRRKGDFFACAVLGQKNGDFWVADVARGRIGAPDQEREIERLAESWQPALIGIEDANEGRAVYQHLNERARLPLKLVTPRGDKEFRAIPLANGYRAGKIFHPEHAKFVRPLEAEMEAFPAGPHDDQVDALSGAYNLVTQGSGFRVRHVG